MSVLRHNCLLRCETLVSEKGVSLNVSQLTSLFNITFKNLMGDLVFFITLISLLIFSYMKQFTLCPCIRWFKYDRDWFVCKQAALRSSCATLREWSHNLHPPSCSVKTCSVLSGSARVMSEQNVPRSVEQRIVIKFLVGENVPSTEIHHRLQQRHGEELRSAACLHTNQSRSYLKHLVNF